jgi:hypothetical protein
VRYAKITSLQASAPRSCSSRRAHSDGLRFFVRITLDDIRDVPLKLDGLCDEKRGVYTVRSKRSDAQEDERGFTLPGFLTRLAILGILIAITVIIFLADLEHWRVNAATKQPVGDHWHSHLTDQLNDWRGTLTLDRTEHETPRYYLIKQANPYGRGDPRPAVSGGVNGCTQTLATQVALRNRMW